LAWWFTPRVRYLGDLGLATSHRFELSAPEREFLINWLVAAVAIRRACAAAGFEPVPGSGPLGR
jgi:hypothetical protein